jgi:DNA-binding protein H-NS
LKTNEIIRIDANEAMKSGTVSNIPFQPAKSDWSPHPKPTRRVPKMETEDLKLLPVDQLWNLHEELVAELSRRIVAEKASLEQRLHKLGLSASNSRYGRLDRPRRPYPKVLPRYRNPKNPTETWAGRGKQPRWLRAQLRSGKRLDDFRIKHLAG